MCENYILLIKYGFHSLLHKLYKYSFKSYSLKTTITTRQHDALSLRHSSITFVGLLDIFILFSRNSTSGKIEIASLSLGFVCSIRLAPTDTDANLVSH